MKPNIAFLPSSGMGHIFPLFNLAKTLVLHHGLTATLLVITTQASAAQAQFLAAAAVPNLNIVNLPPADVSAVITADMRIVTQLSHIARESLKPLKQILSELRPTSLVIDIFTTDAIDVCKELSIPVYSFFTASSVLLTFSLCFPTLDREVEGEFVDLPAPVEIPGCPKMRTEDIADPLKDRKNDDYKWYLLHVSRLTETSGVLLNAWEDLDPERIKALSKDPFFKEINTPPVFPVGPLIRDDEILSESDARVLAWLDNQPPESVVYVSLGSGGTLSTKQLAELALGLEMSRRRFILVVRRPTDATASAAFFNVGGGKGDIENDDNNTCVDYLPYGFLERTHGVGVVVPEWAPQLTVLRHPSIGAFLSHCGWNSTLESLVNGVPMIAWPLYAEQRMNASMLVDEIGVAMRLTSAEYVMVGRGEVVRAVTAMMDEEEGRLIRRRARETMESAREALEDGGSSFRSLCSFVGNVESTEK